MKFLSMMCISENKSFEKNYVRRIKGGNMLVLLLA